MDENEEPLYYGRAQGPSKPARSIRKVLTLRDEHKKYIVKMLATHYDCNGTVFCKFLSIKNNDRFSVSLNRN